MKVLIEALQHKPTKIKNSVGAYIFEVPMVQTDIYNNNGRMYPSQLVDPIVEEYKSRFIATNRAVGELHHPNQENLRRINYNAVAIKITEVKKVGKDWIGKFTPIVGTPRGDIVQALAENDVVFATSTRGVGAEDRNRVVNKYSLITLADVEYAPGAPDAFASILTEGAVDPTYFKSEQDYESILNLVKHNNINMAFTQAMTVLNSLYANMEK